MRSQVRMNRKGFLTLEKEDKSQQVKRVELRPGDPAATGSNTAGRLLAIGRPGATCHLTLPENGCHVP